jgi:dipeptidase E
MLRYEANQLELIGARPMRIFKHGVTPYEVQPGADLSFLL